uniref:PHD-type domain-containing protein n=1 Tax=Lygus hesperus TaxID=30085 RepID=A0A0K8SI30_LYGHE
MMKKKVDGSQKDVVGAIMNELLVNTSQFITTGVPPHILIAELADSLAHKNGDSDVNKYQKKAKELIELEVKNETLVRFPSGNYLHGPRKNDGRESAGSGEESDSVKMSAEEEEGDEEEDEEEEEEEEDRHSKKDTDYSPTYVPKNVKRTIKRGEGRTSSRMKKSRFDSDEYVFPTIVKNLNKRSPAAVQEKPRKRPGPKPKKKCPICSLYTSGSDAVTSTCQKCPIKGHLSCVETEMSGKGQDVSNWICCYCKPVPKKWKCTICNEGASKDMGILVTCESCNMKYHRSCHSPAIQVKQMKNWKCVRCGMKPPPAGRGKDSGEIARSKETVDSSVILDDSEDDADNLDFSLRCYACHNKFYNPANKLKCAECHYLFHTRCCRVKTAENAARLGSKRHKWKCDKCRFSTGPGMKQVDTCRVVVPRLQLKSEPSDSSEDCSVSCRTRRIPQKKGRVVESKPPSVNSESKNARITEADEQEKLRKRKSVEIVQHE